MFSFIYLRIRRWAVGAALLVVGLIFGAPLGAAAASPKEANVLLVTIDTLRYDRIGILSDKYVKTPNLDDFARRAVIFDRAYAHTPLTRPSHTNILTGTTPLYHGVSDNPGFKLESRYQTLAEFLQGKKYRTGAFIGAFVLDHRFGLDKGFDRYDDEMGEQEVGQLEEVERTADQVIKPALAWISGQNSKWFCWVHLFDPHDPYAPPEPFKSQYRDDPYSGEVAFVDQQLGVLFDALRKNGTLQNTIVIVTADHGEALGEKEEARHGFFAYNNTLHVPLILAYPGAVPARVQENAGHIDIFPTVCDLLGLSAPSQIQGESLLPLIAGRPRKNARIYFESLSPHLSLDCAPLTGYIEGTMKYIDQPIKELYDLGADPREEHNLAPSSDMTLYAKNLEALKKSLKGKGTIQDLKGESQDIAPLMKSLGYISGTPTKKRTYEIADDMKTLQPLIAQFRQAIEEYRAGGRETAVKKLANIVRIRPTYISAYSALADAYYSLGRVDQAVTTVKEGLTRNADNLHLMSKLGTLLVMANRMTEAIDPLEYCVKKDKFDADNFNYLGRALLSTGDFEAAEERFMQALAIDPKLVAACNNLGYLYLSMYKKSEEEKYCELAIQYFDKALALNPGLQSSLKGKEAALHFKSLW
jgi:arylsulfatase A-like enzyme/Flp pilus assembly protein TadD